MTFIDQQQVCNQTCASQMMEHPGVILRFIIPPVLISIGCSYCWSVLSADVHYFLPYISDAGGDPPQSGIFGLGMVSASIACVALFSVRYIMVSDTNREKKRSIQYLNYLTFLFGISIFFGIVMVAVNPTGHLRRDGTWLQPIFVTHLVGAAMTFTGGVGYLTLNTALTFLMIPEFHNVRVAYVRLALTIVDIVACIITGIKFPKDLLTMKPHPNKPRTYPEGTLISIVSEWVMLLTVLSYFYTMKDEMDQSIITIGLHAKRIPVTGAPSAENLHPS